MPLQRPGTSEQTVCTPRAFLNAVERRFGPITFDLAATSENEVTGSGFYFGPGSSYGENALVVPWPREGLLWCNPPYGLIKGNGFARKGRLEAEKGSRIAMLIPAAVATNWYADEIHGHAFVLPIRPRLTFVGHKDPYPKDLMLCMFGPGANGFEPWAWNSGGETP